MSPLQVLNAHYVGKTIIGDTTNNLTLREYIGATILRVDMEEYEPMFTFTLQLPTGRIAIVNVLDDWNIEVK